MASGKSAVGSLVARHLGYRFLDTGAMYRALTWFILQRGVDPEDEEAVGQIAPQVRMTVGMAPEDSGEHCSVQVDGQDATPFLVRPDVEGNVSQVSRVLAVRQAMVGIQRQAARGGGVVMVGRDIGTVVLPNAELKVYLDASREERAKRRHEQALLRGDETSLEAVLEDLTQRDAIDSGRETSPLRPAEDAITINTEGLTLEQVGERILRLVQ